MAATVTFFFLLWWSCVQSVSALVVFSDGIQLMVEDKNGTVHLQDKTRDRTPLVQIFSLDQSTSARSQILICVLDRLTSPEADVLWWIDNTLVNSTDANTSWSRHRGGYSATCLWDVKDWNRSVSYWCGTEQDGQVYKQRLCED